MTKLFLLTGGSGTLGTELQKSASEYDIEYVAPNSFDLNVAEYEGEYWLERYDHLDFCGIVHCAAYTDVPGAEMMRRESIAINIIGTKNAALCASTHDIKLIYISTDYVYPGEHGNYSEEDDVRPINYYAITKLLGEAYVNQNLWPADKDRDLIIRTSFKPNKPWPYSEAFDDLYTSADYVDVIAPKINFLIANAATGIYNVGTERKTIFELASRRNKIGAKSRKDIKNLKLPKDISMNLKKFENFCQKNV